MREKLNINKIFASEESKEYQEACKQVQKYLKKGLVESLATVKRYKKAIEAYRIYLDMNNAKLQPAKFPLCKEDPRTFKYKDILLRDLITGGVEYIKMIPNPNWCYLNFN